MIVGQTETPTETKTAETQTETPTETKTETKPDVFSERFAALTKKEKLIQRSRDEVRALKDSLTKREADLAAREERAKQFESINNPLEALKLKGWSYDDLTNFVLNNEKPTPDKEIQLVRSELQKIREEQAAEKQRQTEAQTKAHENELASAIDQFKSEVTSFVKSKADDYELINLFDQSGLVYDTIKQYYETNQKLLSVKDGCDLVEKYLETKATKIAKAKKLQSVLTTQSKDSSETQSKTPNQAQSRTLTNNMTSSVPSMLPAKTETDRLQRAMAALEK